MNLHCPGCTRLALDLGLTVEEAHEIMLNSKILNDKDTLRYQIQGDLSRHHLSFEAVYQKILAHKDDCIYYVLL